MLAVACLTGISNAFVKGVFVYDSNFNSVFEENFFKSRAYVEESKSLVYDLIRLLGEYKNQEHILSGGTISKDELSNIESILYEEYQFHPARMNPELTEAENYEAFRKEYADEIAQEKERSIKADLREYHTIVQNIKEYKAPLFYASDSENVFTNTKLTERKQFEANPSFWIYDNFEQKFFPKEIKENIYFTSFKEQMDEMDLENTVIYIAFTEEYLHQKTAEWQEDKAIATKYLSQIIVFAVGFLLSLIYLIVIIGRRSFTEKELYLRGLDRLYNDINLVLCIASFMLWMILVDSLFENLEQLIIPLTIPIAAILLVLILSWVKHIKNNSFFKHTLIYFLINHVVQFVGGVYRSGNLAVKTVLIVIGYPILVVATFFMFPVTLGIAAWFAFKKVKAFRAIQEGVEMIKSGELQHRIEVDGKGEFSKLATDINSITDGLKNAVNSELKSERLKTELITNVSHDIRTPLTSIITYVDLLKHEKDSLKAAEYIEVLEQKSKRLKVLTDDLFEAAKASSGNIPVDFDKIDIVSLLTQGLGEVNDKVEVMELEFKLNPPKEKVYIMADGKLLWRSIENLLSNIFKYALVGSRVYIDMEDLGQEVRLTFKNISANELNIQAEELMERFKRGDESRTSEGSGLGLSIAKNLIELQKGKFNIQIDGDLFKAILYLPKYTAGNEE